MKRVNWGTGIVLAFIGFISFVLFFVYKMSTDQQADHDLVTEDYYQKELAYQDEIDALNNAQALNSDLTYKRTENGLVIDLPTELEDDQASGNVSLYRPSNKHLDFDFPISLSSTHLLIPDKRLLDGRWDIKILVTHEGKQYLFKKRITY
ncbi:MAG: FixH family protein [Eudoraea sp.]|nr:FixH family protein [Eudoraea sp.]